MRRIISILVIILASVYFIVLFVRYFSKKTKHGKKNRFLENLFELNFASILAAVLAIILSLIMYNNTPQASIPSFSPTKTDYTPDEGPITVTITSPNSHDIYYTLDDSDPMVSGKIYTGPMTIDKKTTLRAKCKVNDSQWGEEAVINYIIEPDIYVYVGKVRPSNIVCLYNNKYVLCRSIADTLDITLTNRRDLDIKIDSLYINLLDHGQPDKVILVSDGGGAEGTLRKYEASISLKEGEYEAKYLGNGDFLKLKGGESESISLNLKAEGNSILHCSISINYTIGSEMKSSLLLDDIYLVADKFIDNYDFEVIEFLPPGSPKNEMYDDYGNEVLATEQDGWAYREEFARSIQNYENSEGLLELFDLIYDWYEIDIALI